MARSLPMCVVNPIPGQEERNSDHLLEAGVAIKCNNPPTLGWKIENLIRDPAALGALAKTPSPRQALRRPNHRPRIAGENPRCT